MLSNFVKHPIETTYAKRRVLPWGHAASFSAEVNPNEPARPSACLEDLSPINPRNPVTLNPLRLPSEILKPSPRQGCYDGRPEQRDEHPRCGWPSETFGSLRQYRTPMIDPRMLEFPLYKDPNKVPLEVEKFRMLRAWPFFGSRFPKKVANPKEGCPYHNMVAGLRISS